jgi:hypothetical protein
MEKNNFCFRMHNAQGKYVLAACDPELIGKTLRYGEVDFPVDSSFYGEEEAGEEDILEMCERAHTANFVGKRIVSMLVERDVVDKDSVLWIEDVPHVQILRF